MKGSGPTWVYINRSCSIDVLSLGTVNYYSANAQTLASRYNSLDPEALHASWSHFIPDDPGIALDVGAGSGRDANWLAEKGWDVVAVEPCMKFQELAKPASPHFSPRLTF